MEDDIRPTRSDAFGGYLRTALGTLPACGTERFAGLLDEIEQQDAKWRTMTFQTSRPSIRETR